MHQISWVHAAGLRLQCVIAASMENAELDICDPKKILSGHGYALVFPDFNSTSWKFSVANPLIYLFALDRVCQLNIL
jgi:hypothetical protein